MDHLPAQSAPYNLPTLDSVVRAVFEEHLNSKQGFDGDLEPLMADVVQAVREFVREELPDQISAAVRFVCERAA